MISYARFHSTYLTVYSLPLITGKVNKTLEPATIGSGQYYAPLPQNRHYLPGNTATGSNRNITIDDAGG